MSGRATLWIAKDGQAPVRRGTVAGTLLQGQVPQVERISLGMNFNRVRNATQSQSMWYGQWEVIDGALNANPFGVVLP